MTGKFPNEKMQKKRIETVKLLKSNLKYSKIVSC